MNKLDTRESMLPVWIGKNAAFYLEIKENPHFLNYCKHSNKREQNDTVDGFMDIVLGVEDFVHDCLGVFCRLRDCLSLDHAFDILKEVKIKWIKMNEEFERISNYFHLSDTIKYMLMYLRGAINLRELFFHFCKESVDLARMIIDWKPDEAFEFLLISSENGFYHAVDILLQDWRVDPSAQENIAIIRAAENGKIDTMHRLMQDPRVDPSAQNNEAIILAAKNGHIGVLYSLMHSLGVKPFSQNNEAIILAAKNGHIEVVNQLLNDPRVDPSDQNNEAIILAAKNGHLRVVQRLLKNRRVDPSAQGDRALRSAAAKGHRSVVVHLSKDPRVDFNLLRIPDTSKLTFTRPDIFDMGEWMS